MADALMRAFVQLRADDTGLRQDAQAKVRAATAGVEARAKVTLDTTQLDRDRAALQARLSALGARASVIRANLDVNDKDGLAKIAAFQVRLASLDKRTASAKITVEGLARAEAQILALDASMSRIDSTARGSRGGIAALIGEITGFGAAGTAASRDADLFVRALAGINLATGVLEPVLAGVTVAVAGTAAAFTAAGIGLGVFGAVAGSVLSQASDAAKKYAQAQAQAAKAENPAQRAAALKAQQQALAGLDSAQLSVVHSIQQAQSAWQGFTRAATPGVAKVLADAVGLLPRAFALMQPFLGPVETALRNIMAQMKAAIAPGTQFSSIMGQLAAASGPLLQQALQSAGNILMGVLGVVRAFLPAGMQLSAWIVDATAKFREWGLTLQSHTGFQSLMAMFREQTPQAMEILRNLGTVIVNVGKAMTGLSTFSNSRLLLNMLEPLTGILARLSGDRTLVNIALYMLAIGAAASKLAPAFEVAAKGARLLAGALGLASATPIMLIAAAVIALGAAFYVAWQKSAGFRNVMKDIASGFLEAGIIIVQVNKTIIDAFLSMVGTVLHAAATAFGWVPGLGGMLRSASAHFDAFKAGVDNTMNGMIGTMQRWRDDLNNNVSAVRDATAKITADFNAQAQAATTARGALSSYTTAITQNGVNSDVAKAARDTLVADLVKAGVNAATAQRDVAAYTTAVQQNGINSDVAGAARQRLVNDILAASNNAKVGKTDLDNYSSAVVTFGLNADQTQGARAKLIQDLVNSGMSAKDAAGLVDGLGRSVNGLPPSKKVLITMQGDGTYRITSGTGQAPGTSTAAGRGSAAGGGLITGPGGPTSDRAGLYALSDGEWVIRAASAARYGMAAMAAVNRGTAVISYAAGGPVATGNLWQGNYPQRMYDDFQAQFTAAMVAAMRAAIKAAQSAATAAAGAAGTAGGSVAAELQRQAAARGWTGAQWDALYALEMAEAGFSLTATNPSSGAYGIAQFIRGASEYYDYGGNPNTAAGQATGMLNYIAERYGTPAAAWAHEKAYGWYDAGGWLPRGLSLAYNGTGYPEQVLPPSAGDSIGALAGELRAIRAQIARLTEVAEAAPSRTGRHVGDAVNSAAAGAVFRARYPAGGI